MRNLLSIAQHDEQMTPRPAHHLSIWLLLLKTVHLSSKHLYLSVFLGCDLAAVAPFCPSCSKCWDLRCGSLLLPDWRHHRCGSWPHPDWSHRRCRNIRDPCPCHGRTLLVLCFCCSWNPAWNSAGRTLPPRYLPFQTTDCHPVSLRHRCTFLPQMLCCTLWALFLLRHTCLNNSNNVQNLHMYRFCTVFFFIRNWSYPHFTHKIKVQ